MEPTTLATATIAALFTSEAAKAGGKALGEGTSKLVSQLLTVIRNKFKASKTEGVLVMAEEQPTELNVNLVKTVLLAQIEKDEEFANLLRELLLQLDTQREIRQVVVERSQGDRLKVNNIVQNVVSQDSSEQVIVSDSEIKDINLNRVNQTYRHDS